MLSLQLGGCDSQQGSANNQSAGMCSQANEFLDKYAAGELKPQRWADMMVAGSRVVYVNSECGDRIDLPLPELCAELGTAIDAFAADEKVPAGKNRDTALKQSRQVFKAAGC